MTSASLRDGYDIVQDAQKVSHKILKQIFDFNEGRAPSRTSKTSVELMLTVRATPFS